MYSVKFYKGEYTQRQRQANEDQAVAYVEHHFNSSSSAQAEYAVVVVGSNASQTSRNWGRWYAKAVADQYETRIGGDQGILVWAAGTVMATETSVTPTCRQFCWSLCLRATCDRLRSFVARVGQETLGADLG